MEVEETRQKKTWWDCIRVDMKSSDLSHEETHDGDLWRLRGRDGRNGLLGANWKIADTVVCVCYSIRPEKPNVVRDNRLVKQKKTEFAQKKTRTQTNTTSTAAADATSTNTTTDNCCTNFFLFFFPAHIY